MTGKHDMELKAEKEVESTLIVGSDHRTSCKETSTLLRIEKCRACEEFTFNFVTLGINGESINVNIELEDVVETLSEIGSEAGLN